MSTPNPIAGRSPSSSRDRLVHVSISTRQNDSISFVGSCSGPNLRRHWRIVRRASRSFGLNRRCWSFGCQFQCSRCYLRIRKQHRVVTHVGPRSRRQLVSFFLFRDQRQRHSGAFHPQHPPGPQSSCAPPFARIHRCPLLPPKSQAAWRSFFP